MNESRTKLPIPLYKKVKRYVLERIEDGSWKPFDKILSESQLVSELGTSRMTVVRALRELTEEGYIVRLAGVGSFVAELKPQSHPLEIHNIADEIRSRGGEHDCTVHLVAREVATREVAKALAMRVESPVFHSIIVHRENGVPLQLEDRYVKPSTAPNFLEVDFNERTPAEYLMEVAPLQQVEHVVEAIAPDAETARLLDIKESDPCLLLRRRTWAFGIVASYTKLCFPGHRYRLGGRFKPDNDNDIDTAQTEQWFTEGGQ
jgi:GntR family histidine utilization transcriptional repressor